MACRNLRLRGGSYHWRRKVTVCGNPIPLSFALGTGNFQKARAITAALEARIEILRMGYGQPGLAIAPAQLKRVFSDALRWQLDRILAD